MLLTDRSVAMVTYSVTKIKPMCSPVIGQFFLYHDCSINWLRVVVMTHQKLSLGMCWKLFWATLIQFNGSKTFISLEIFSRHLCYNQNVFSMWWLLGSKLTCTQWLFLSLRHDLTNKFIIKLKSRVPVVEVLTGQANHVQCQTPNSDCGLL